VARNPAQTPNGASAVPTELSPEQRTALKNLVERQGSLRLAAIFALGYWARLRISEVAMLRLDHCVLNQRAGTITIVGAKGGKTRTLESPFQTGGYAACWAERSVLAIAFYQRATVARRSSFNTCPQTSSSRCAPCLVQRICCFFTVRLLTTWLTVDSTKPVAIASPYR